jgi:hypothetical protein
MAEPGRRVSNNGMDASNSLLNGLLAARHAQDRVRTILGLVSAFRAHRRHAEHTS